MNREVNLIIRGFHNGTDEVETRAEAIYVDKQISRYVVYEEKDENFSEPIKGRIKFRDNYLEITRTGPISSQMIFEKGKKVVSEYKTPFGNMTLGIDTRDMTLFETDDEIRIRVVYVLEINGEHQSDSSTEISLKNGYRL